MPSQRSSYGFGPRAASDCPDTDQKAERRCLSAFRLMEKSKDFSISLKKCRYFPTAQRWKSPRYAR